MYGATDGECYFRGVAGERFAVRNSARSPWSRARRSLLRIHDRRHRGRARKTGRNFAAGMSGGIAYVSTRAATSTSSATWRWSIFEPVLSEELINAGTYHHTGDLEAHGRVDVFKNLLSSTSRASRPDLAPRQGDRLQARRRHPCQLVDWLPNPQGDAGRVPARAARNGGQRGRRAENRDRGVVITPRHCERAKQSRLSTWNHWIASSLRSSQ